MKILKKSIMDLIFPSSDEKPSKVESTAVKVDDFEEVLKSFINPIDNFSTDEYTKIDINLEKPSEKFKHI